MVWGAGRQDQAALQDRKRAIRKLIKSTVATSLARSGHAKSADTLVLCAPWCDPSAEVTDVVSGFSPLLAPPELSSSFSSSSSSRSCLAMRAWIQRG
mmetsp:Transcript_72078/g.182232  ORF Transcript_72078/g.182232 Transcript_72078/m.182232 type:complete len:97 (+) Transcript_72078:482-772(+)